MDNSSCYINIINYIISINTSTITITTITIIPTARVRVRVRVSFVGSSPIIMTTKRRNDDEISLMYYKKKIDKDKNKNKDMIIPCNSLFSGSKKRSVHNGNLKSTSI